MRFRWPGRAAAEKASRQRQSVPQFCCLKREGSVSPRGWAHAPGPASRATAYPRELCTDCVAELGQRVVRLYRALTTADIPVARAGAAPVQRSVAAAPISAPGPAPGVTIALTSALDMRMTERTKIMHETIGRIANALYLDGQRPGGSGITKAAARDMARIAASAVTEPEHTPDVHHAANALRDSASALGQIAGTLSELLAMAKAENEVGLAQDFDRQGGYVTASFAQE